MVLYMRPVGRAFWPWYWPVQACDVLGLGKGIPVTCVRVGRLQTKRPDRTGDCRAGSGGTRSLKPNPKAMRNPFSRDPSMFWRAPILRRSFARFRKPQRLDRSPRTDVAQDGVRRDRAAGPSGDHSPGVGTGLAIGLERDGVTWLQGAPVIRRAPFE